MRRFVKGSLITAGVLAAVGCVLCLIYGVIGGRSLIYQAQNDVEKVERILSDIHVDLDGQTGEKHAQEQSGNGQDDGIMTETTQEISAQEIRNLELNLGAGEFTIRQKEVADGIISISASGEGNYNSYVKNGTLYVTHTANLIHIGNLERGITLEIPADMTFDEVEVELGAGIVNLSDLTAREFDATVGAGEFYVERMETTEFSAEIGAGSLSAQSVSTREAEIDVSMGECVFQGTISENLDAECAMGSMEFYLTGREEDHNYEIECAAGNIEIGSLAFHAIGMERKINNNAFGVYEVSCGAGNIVIQFEQ